MPANLTPQYYKAEERFKAAKTLDEKVEALEEMLAVIPKHKGTDKLCGDLKKKLSKLRSQEGKKSGGATRATPYKIQRAGAGMAVLVGPPNSGKSAILDRLTNASPKVAPYPYTTRIPLPGMMAFENATVQLVDTPPVSEEFYEPDLSSLVRKADIALLTLDASDPEVLDSMDMVKGILESAKVVLDPEGAPLEPGLPARIKTFLVLTRIDLPDGAEALEVIGELVPGYKILPVSTETGEGLDDFTREVFLGLDVVRAYTKTPGKKPDLDSPVYMKRGETVIDFAREIHKDFAENLKFARIWGEGKYDGQSVNRDHEINDGDIIELHI